MQRIESEIDPGEMEESRLSRQYNEPTNPDMMWIYQPGEGTLFCEWCRGRTTKLTNTGRGRLLCDGCVGLGR